MSQCQNLSYIFSLEQSSFPNNTNLIKGVSPWNHSILNSFSKLWSLFPKPSSLNVTHLNSVWAIIWRLINAWRPHGKHIACTWLQFTTAHVRAGTTGIRMKQGPKSPNFVYFTVFFNTKAFFLNPVSYNYLSHGGQFYISIFRTVTRILPTDP